MRINTKAVFEWNSDTEQYEEIYSEGYDYEGEVDLLQRRRRKIISGEKYGEIIDKRFPEGQTIMERMTQGETGPIAEDMLGRWAERGESRSDIVKKKASQIMGGIEGLVVMKAAYDEGGIPQDYVTGSGGHNKAPRGTTVDTERMVGSKAIERWVNQLPPDQHDNFYTLLGQYEEGYLNRHEDDDYNSYNKAYENMQSFLAENLMYDKPLQIRRIEDDLVDGWTVGDSKSMIMGE